MMMHLLALLALLVQDPAGDLEPGLIAVYRSLADPQATVTRIDAKPAFALGDSSPHPAIPPGPFEVVWTGLLLFQDADSITIRGDAAIEIDGTALAGPIEVKPGFHRIRVVTRSTRVQLTWEGKTFSREPIPPWKFRHAAADFPETLRLETRGRAQAGRLGCARCHQGAFPGVQDPPPGPSLADLGQRVSASWLTARLGQPGARMPRLFEEGRAGYVDRWILSRHLLKGATPAPSEPAGDHRMGRRHFVSVGCVACHFLPDEPVEDQPVRDRRPLEKLYDRMTHAQLAAFLADPKQRYPDGRMPGIPMPAAAARDIAAFVLLWSKPSPELPEPAAPQPAELESAARRLGVNGLEAAGEALLRAKRCVQCHAGLGDSAPADVPMKTPGVCKGARFELDEKTAKELAAYGRVSSRDRHPSPFEVRQRRLESAGCLRCHSRDSERPSPLEEAGSVLGGAWLQMVPFLKTPRLSNAGSKYSREYLLASLRDGVTAVRHSKYSYRMPAYGAEAESLVQALLEGDGEDPAPEPPPPADPTLPPLGPSLVGFGGYSCVSCHIWRGQSFAEPDPGAIAPELTTVTRRIRREWFDRWLEDPARLQPGTPMPQIFKHGQGATLGAILGGDAAKQKDALWAYFSLGKDAPAPKALPLLALEVPADGPLVAQIPLFLPDKKVVESIVVLYASNDLLVYDVGTRSVREVFVGARILRQVKGRIRQYVVSGTPVNVGPLDPPPGAFEGYDRLPDGVRIRVAGAVQEWRLAGRKLGPIDLPPAQAPATLEAVALVDPGKIDGVLERPGYRAIAYPRPKTASGEDLVMPGAIAADPRDGRVFVASMKRGELFVVRDPDDTGKKATFEDYTGGLFQEAYSMVAESGALYVLHRRNLTRITDSDGDGRADRFDRVAALPHGVADSYDYGYGLNRDKTGAFVMTYAPYANTSIPGSGSLIRLLEGGKTEELAYGFRNPLGWTPGPDGDLYYTDNQGEWVATNKLCRIVPGRFYGFPNNVQRQHAQKPFGKTAVWVPYAWAHSINGVTYDASGGKFGPFAGQFFLAELMFGGALIRASVETVNGEVQGCCFPFWGKGLLGPVVLTFDPKGRLWVGGITEPGWMAQPDRGGLFRIDFTGATPFEIREIRVLRDGFRLNFTAPVDPKSAADPASYLAEHYRYEYTGSYGSPELDRTRAAVEGATVAADGLSVDLKLAPLVKDRIYMITARGVTSVKGEKPVQPTGAYTLNEIPR